MPPGREGRLQALAGDLAGIVVAAVDDLAQPTSSRVALKSPARIQGAPAPAEGRPPAPLPFVDVTRLRRVRVDADDAHPATAGHPLGARRRPPMVGGAGEPAQRQPRVDADAGGARRVDHEIVRGSRPVAGLGQFARRRRGSAPGR